MNFKASRATSSRVSVRRTRKPPTAATWAIPLPMAPAPTTPIVRSGRSGSKFKPHLRLHIVSLPSGIRRMQATGPATAFFMADSNSGIILLMEYRNKEYSRHEFAANRSQLADGVRRNPHGTELDAGREENRHESARNEQRPIPPASCSGRPFVQADFAGADSDTSREGTGRDR